VIHRDRITVHSKRDGQDVEQVVYGTVVTEEAAGELTQFGAGLVFKSFYRLILPASLDLAGARDISVSWGTRTKTRLESAITPSYLHGRVHHYEGIVRSA
jgi:hypothetical protein